MQKSSNNIAIGTDALTIKSFKNEENLEAKEDDLKKNIGKLSVLNIENKDYTKQSITLAIENNEVKIKSITGNISLQDITDNNENNKGIAKYIAKKLKENTDTDFNSSKLTINTFYKTQQSEYISTPITPTFLKETKLNALNKAILNFKDSKNDMHITFKSRQGETEEKNNKIILI